MYLIADVGGSKTTLALVPTLEGSWEPVTSETLASRRFTGLESLVAEYLKHKDVTITAACFGVPGPVFDNECKTTNLPWLVSANTLESQLGIPTVYLLNDLQALACAIPHLDGPDDLETLQEGRRDPRGTVGVIAPGTGLGEAFGLWEGGRFHGRASEGGHTDFGPITEDQRRLLAYLTEQYGHVSYEHVLSGPGIHNIYRFLEERGPDRPDPDFTRSLAGAEDPVVLIVDAAVDRSDPLCLTAVDLFVSILGAEVGNLALKLMATGGVYIGGNLVQRLLPLLRSDTFRRAYFAKGPLSDVLKRIPVYAITADEPHLRGLASYLAARIGSA